MFYFNIEVKEEGEGPPLIGDLAVMTDDPEEPGRLLMKGPPEFMAIMTDFLTVEARGPFGHPFNIEGIRPSDLNFALSQDKRFEVIASPDLSDHQFPTPPEGAVS